MGFLNNMWWEAKDEVVHIRIFEYVDALDKRQSHITHGNLQNMRLYGNAEFLGTRIGQFHKSKKSARMTLNVVKSTIDTVVSKMTKNVPKATFLTDGGDWLKQERAKKLDKFVHGAFWQSGFYDKNIKILKDGGVFGNGIVHFFFDGKDGQNLRCERVFPEEIKIDQDEAIYGNPRQIHRVKFIGKDVLAARFPKFKAKIESARAPREHFLVDKHGMDQIQVIESYRLPAISGGTDGRHLLTIQNADLFDEKWDVDWWPYSFFHFNEKLLGFWSEGLAELLTGIQVEINQLLIRVMDIMRLGSVPKIFMEKGSKIVKSRFNNLIGTVIEYTGTPPTSGDLMKVPKDLFLQIENLYQKAFQEAGVSQLAAQSKKPPGINSGKALREFSDIESERFLSVGRNWQTFHMDCSKLLINMAKRQDKFLRKSGKKGLITISRDNKSISRIKWSEVDLDESSYVMQLYPTDLFSNTPSGKLSEVADLMQIGFLDKEEANSLIDFPDIKYTLNLKNSQIDDINAMIYNMMYKLEYEPPEPFQNIQLGLQMVQESYLRFKRQNAPDDALELLRRWMSEALAMTNPEEQEIIEEETEALTPEQEAEIAALAAQQEEEDTVNKITTDELGPLVREADEQEEQIQ